MNESDFEALLRQEIVPPERPPDRAFVARIDSAVAQEAWFREWRARILRELSGEVLGLASVVGALAFAARAPGVREAIGGAPELAGTAVLLLILLAWLLIRGKPDALA